MKRRSMGLAIWVGLTVGATGLTGCSGDDGKGREAGTLRLPLLTQAPSGATYRLRDATFEIRNEYYYYEEPSGAGGAGDQSPPITLVSSETNPDASAIDVSVERGYYYVQLRPGWRLEKVEDGVVTDVEATLLSPATQWVYVAARSSTWLEYQFGLGDRSLWFNGKLTLQIAVYEKPSDLYGGGGEPGISQGGWSGSP